MNYIEIEKDLIPYSFEIDLGGSEYTFEVHYNYRFDYFTISLYKNGEILVLGEKIILDRPLFEGLANINLPKVNIVPMDRAKLETRITYENLESTIFLYILDGDEHGSV